MESERILRRLKKWKEDWELYLPLNDTNFGKGGEIVKGFTLKRLEGLIKEIEGA